MINVGGSLKYSPLFKWLNGMGGRVISLCSFIPISVTCTMPGPYPLKTFYIGYILSAIQTSLNFLLMIFNIFRIDLIFWNLYCWCLKHVSWYLYTSCFIQSLKMAHTKFRDMGGFESLPTMLYQIFKRLDEYFDQ